MLEPDLLDIASMGEPGLLDLAAIRLETLLAEPDTATTSTLDRVMKRLFDPRDRELLTVSAFASSL